MKDKDSQILDVTRDWVQKFVINLDVCPFAKHLSKDSIRYTLKEHNDLLPILESIQGEFQYLLDNDSIETSLIIYPNCTADFLTFLDIYYACDQLLEDIGLEEQFQIVAFHPEFIFDEAESTDAANYTNRSPYPMIHILRVSSVSKAIAHHPNTEQIPIENMKKLREKSWQHWEEIRSSKL